MIRLICCIAGIGVFGAMHTPASGDDHAPPRYHEDTSLMTLDEGEDAAEDEPASTEDQRKEVLDKAWAYLETMYDKPAPRDDRAGIKSGWGPKSKNVPYTAMVLQGILGTKIWDAENVKIKDSIEWLIDAQEPDGAWSYMPGIPQLKGVRAVYITSIGAQLMADLNKLDPWKGKLNDAIAKAQQYLQEAQVGNPEGPSADYDEGKSGYGGWGYSKQELERNKPSANMSTSTFAIDALKACGVKKGDPMWERALVFLKRNQNAGEVQDEGFEPKDSEGRTVKPAAEGSPDHGGAKYAEESSEGVTENEDGTVTFSSYGTMTYNLLRSYLFAGLKKDSIPVKLAKGWIQRNYTVERVPGIRDKEDFEKGLYYYYMSMGKTLNVLGEDAIEEPERGLKHDWRQDLVGALKERQNEDGSWVNSNRAWQENSPVLCTAYALEALRNAKK